MDFSIQFSHFFLENHDGLFKSSYFRLSGFNNLEVVFLLNGELLDVL